MGSTESLNFDQSRKKAIFMVFLLTPKKSPSTLKQSNKGLAFVFCETPQFFSSWWFQPEKY